MRVRGDIGIWGIIGHYTCMYLFPESYLSLKHFDLIFVVELKKNKAKFHLILTEHRLACI